MANFNQPASGPFYPLQTTITAGTNVTAYPTIYPNQINPYAAPPANWANFPCGHQMKLEPGQPYPSRCQVCPTPEAAHHEYKKCGHIHNYEKGPNTRITSVRLESIDPDPEAPDA